MRAPRAETRRFTRVEYDRFIDQGFFDEDERIELLDGLLVVREPQGSQHAVAVELARAALQRAFGRGHHIRGHSPSRSTTSPSRSPISPWCAEACGNTRPRTLFTVLVVEVADSSLRKDRERKAVLYARAGVPDYWIVNLIDRVLEVYREPERSAAGRGKYRSVALLGSRATVSPLAAPRRRIQVADLLP